MNLTQKREKIKGIFQIVTQKPTTTEEFKVYSRLCQEHDRVATWSELKCNAFLSFITEEKQIKRQTLLNRIFPQRRAEVEKFRAKTATTFRGFLKFNEDNGCRITLK
jgi:hypothetical protein